MKRKVLSTLLCLTMAAGMLAGCGSSNTGSTGSDSAETAQSSQSESDGAAEAAAAYADGFAGRTEVRYDYV